MSDRQTHRRNEFTYKIGGSYSNSFQRDAVSLWAPCDHKLLIACMWSMITCNWLNKNIKSLSKVQFEINNKTLKMFLITKWENFINF